MKTSRPPRIGMQETAVDLSVLDSYLGFHMKRADAAVFQLFSSLIPRHRVVRGEVAILMLARTSPGLSQDAVRRATGLDKSSVSSAIGKLRKRRLIRRQGSDDKRVRKIFLTPQGNTFLNQLHPVINRHERQIASRLTAGERRQLLMLLSKVFDGASNRE